MIKHFLSLASFSTDAIISLLDRAQYFSLQQHQPDKISSILKHHILANAFYEPSTRTRCSFEIAAKKLGAEVINFMPESSSVKKGETVYDTVKTLESLGVDALILRHGDDYLFEELPKKVNIPLINAGAGKREHPSQGLLDLLTLKQEFGQLANLKIAICGDVKHSRVAGSLLIAAEQFGMEVFLCGPEVLLPAQCPAHVKISKTLEEVLPKVDAVMMLRMQLERHETLDLSSASYHEQFGLTAKRSCLLRPNAIIMHPGPFNRGVEIADEVVEHPQSRIFKQMNNGVAARMAILEWVLGKRNL